MPETRVVRHTNCALWDASAGDSPTLLEVKEEAEKIFGWDALNRGKIEIVLVRHLFSSYRQSKDPLYSPRFDIGITHKGSGFAVFPIRNSFHDLQSIINKYPKESRVYVTFRKNWGHLVIGQELDFLAEHKQA